MIDHYFTHRDWTIRICIEGKYTHCYIQEKYEPPLFMCCKTPIDARRQAIAYINKVLANEHLNPLRRQRALLTESAIHERRTRRGRFNVRLRETTDDKGDGDSK